MFAGFAVLVLVSAGIVFGALGSVAVGGEHAETSIGFDRANPFAGSLTAGRECTVYLAVLRGRTTLPVTTCTARAAVAPPAKTGAGASDEYGNWFQLYALTPRRTGTYRVACESVGARAGGRYAIGTAADQGAFAVRRLGAAGTAYSLAGPGVLAGGLIALTVGLLRRSSRRRQSAS